MPYLEELKLQKAPESSRGAWVEPSADVSKEKPLGLVPWPPKSLGPKTARSEDTVPGLPVTVGSKALRYKGSTVGTHELARRRWDVKSVRLGSSHLPDALFLPSKAYLKQGHTGQPIGQGAAALSKTLCWQVIVTTFSLQWAYHHYLVRTSAARMIVLVANHQYLHETSQGL